MTSNDSYMKLENNRYGLEKKKEKKHARRLPDARR
jgi:hypothetical protein